MASASMKGWAPVQVQAHASLECRATKHKGSKIDKSCAARTETEGGRRAGTMFKPWGGGGGGKVSRRYTGRASAVGQKCSTSEMCSYHQGLAIAIAMELHRASGTFFSPGGKNGRLT